MVDRSSLVTVQSFRECFHPERCRAFTFVWRHVFVEQAGVSGPAESPAYSETADIEVRAPVYSESYTLTTRPLLPHTHLPQYKFLLHQ